MSNNPTFQHRHYKKIACIIADLDFGLSDPMTRRDVIDTFADALARDNPRFDRARFAAAANGEPSNKKDAR